MLNPFFLQGSKGEQGLVQDLINEQIRMYGIDIHYLPRTYVKKNDVIKEVIESKFENAFPIEAYVSSYDGYGGQGTLLSKFGIQDIDELTLVISKEKFELYISPFIKNLPNTELSARPKEGDLIYFPLGDRIFEIKYVEHESPFYQLQKNYVYELKCELFKYGSEVIDTSIDEIDDNIVDQANVLSFIMVGTGSTATATATIVDGGVSYIEVTNRGKGYTSAPRVAISKPKSLLGQTATAVAILIDGIVDFCDYTDTSRVQSVSLTNSGSGYTEPPSVQFYGGGGSGAEANAYITDGCVKSITVNNGGSGYVTPPTINFIGISSTPASAYALITAGIVTSIVVTNGGSGYGLPPIIVIDSPNITGVGAYIFNEEVIGSNSGTKAKVNSWDYPTKTLKLSNISGFFEVGEEIVGQESGANYTLVQYDNFNTTDPYASNEEIEIFTDKIIDSSENNPFGIP
jgi:hypothetical protein